MYIVFAFLAHTTKQMLKGSFEDWLMCQVELLSWENSEIINERNDGSECAVVAAESDYHQLRFFYHFKRFFNSLTWTLVHHFILLFLQVSKGFHESLEEKKKNQDMVIYLFKYRSNASLPLGTFPPKGVTAAVERSVSTHQQWQLSQQVFTEIH